MAHNYDVGTRAWQPDPTEGWVASELIEKKEEGDKLKLVFELENGEVGALLHLRYSNMKENSVLTVLCVDENYRAGRCRLGGRLKRQPAASDEPYHIGGQR